MKYKAGKKFYITDTLSGSKGFEQVDYHKEKFEVYVIDTIPVSHEKLTLFQSEIKERNIYSSTGMADKQERFRL